MRFFLHTRRHTRVELIAIYLAHLHVFLSSSQKKKKKEKNSETTDRIARVVVIDRSKINGSRLRYSCSALRLYSRKDNAKEKKKKHKKTDSQSYGNNYNDTAVT